MGVKVDVAVAGSAGASLGVWEGLIVEEGFSDSANSEVDITNVLTGEGVLTALITEDTLEHPKSVHDNRSKPIFLIINIYEKT